MLNECSDCLRDIVIVYRHSVTSWTSTRTWQKIFPENYYQGQVERPLLSSASQARCSTNDSTASC